MIYIGLIFFCEITLYATGKVFPTCQQSSAQSYPQKS